MQIPLELPNDLAAALFTPGEDPARVALEALALEGYRSQRLNEHQVRLMLGFETRMQVHAFLAAHDVPLHYSLADLEVDRETANFLRAQRAQEVLQKAG